MEKNYSIEVVDRICVTRFSQKPTPSEIISALDDVSAIGEFQRRLWIFHDGVDLKTEEVKKIAKYGLVVWPVPSRAAIVAPDDLSFGLARMHGALREQEGLETRVFRTEQKAIAWLKEANDM